MTNETLTIALPKAAVWVRDAVKADRANAYGLDEAWTLPKLGGDLPRRDLMPPDYFDEGWHIQGGVITELPFPCAWANCDGCTLSPDWWPRSWGEIRAYVSAIFHDRWYLWLEKFAAAWGWTVDRVRKLGDIVFANILRALKRGLRGLQRLKAELACRTYYRAVRCFGGVGHAAYKRLEGSKVPGSKVLALAVAGSLLLGGCAGCAVPTAWDDPDAAVEIPAHSYSNLVTGETWSYDPQSPQTKEANGGDVSSPEGADAGVGVLQAEEDR